MIYVLAAVNPSLLTFTWCLPFVPISLIAIRFFCLFFFSCFFSFRLLSSYLWVFAVCMGMEAVNSLYISLFAYFCQWNNY